MQVPAQTCYPETVCHKTPHTKCYQTRAQQCSKVTRASNEDSEDYAEFYNHGEGTTRAFSWLKVLALSHKKHYAK